MKLNRRNFVKLGTAAGAAAASVNGMSVFANAMELSLGGKSVSEQGAERKKVPFTCLTCNVEDGGIAFIENGKIVKLEGNPEHPGNRGKLCAKGNAGWQHVYDPSRILHPLKRVGKRGEGKWKRITWEEALDEVAGKINDAIKKDPDSVALHWGRDRTHGATKRFMNAIGSATRLNHTANCESSKKVGMETTWGPDIEVPDFANTQYIINFGSNVMEAGYFHNPYAQRIAHGKVGNKAKMVTFDVRLSNSAGFADEWIPVFPGTDGVVALAMANVIMEKGLANEAFINEWCNVSAAELKAHLSKFTPEMAEKESGVPAATIRRIAVEFASAGPATTYTYRGPAKHVNGTYNEKCTMLLPIITGNIERKGGYNLPRGGGWDNPGGPEPVPPKPTGHSVLAHPPDYPLASHHVCQLIAQRIKEGLQKINVYISYCIVQNYSFPDTETWTEVFKDEKLIPYHVATGFNMSETDALADIILPDTTFLERWDPESMPSSYEAWVGIRQPVVESPGGMPFRRVTIELGKRIPVAKQYYEGLTEEGWMRAHFDNKAGLKEAGGLNYLKEHGVWPKASPTTAEKPFGDEDSFNFGGPSKDKFLGGKIHLHVQKFADWGYQPMPHYEPIKDHVGIPRDGSVPSGKMVMTTFKWNVQTNARTPGLGYLAEIAHKNPAWINAKTAAAKGIKEGDLIRITSDIGHIVTKAHVTQGIHPSVVAVAHSAGRRGMGKMASGQAHGFESGQYDPNQWWTDTGVHCNPIIPIQADPIGGSQAWYDTVVTVEKAGPNDKYGDTKVDSAAARKAYEKTLTLRSPKAAAELKASHAESATEGDKKWIKMKKPS